MWGSTCCQYCTACNIFIHWSGPDSYNWSRFNWASLKYTSPLKHFCPSIVPLYHSLCSFILDLGTLFHNLWSVKYSPRTPQFDKTSISHLPSTVFYGLVALIRRAVTFIITFGSISCRLVPYRIIRIPTTLRPLRLPGLDNDNETLWVSE